MTAVAVIQTAAFCARLIAAAPDIGGASTADLATPRAAFCAALVAHAVAAGVPPQIPVAVWAGESPPLNPDPPDHGEFGGCQVVAKYFCPPFGGKGTAVGCDPAAACVYALTRFYARARGDWSEALCRYACSNGCCDGGRAAAAREVQMARSAGWTPQTTRRGGR